MTRVPGFPNLIPTIPVLLTHLAGMVVAIILLARQQGKRATGLLALIGFALLLVFDLTSFTQGSLIRFLSRQTPAGVRLAHISVPCCCNILDVAAIVCLILAIWQATSSTRAEGADRSQPTTLDRGFADDR
jgi:hypothetical protein